MPNPFGERRRHDRLKTLIQIRTDRRNSFRRTRSCRHERRWLTRHSTFKVRQVHDVKFQTFCLVDIHDPNIRRGWVRNFLMGNVTDEIIGPNGFLPIKKERKIHQLMESLPFTIIKAG